MSPNFESMIYRSSPRDVKAAIRTILLAIFFGAFFFVLIPLMHNMQKPEVKDITLRALPPQINIEKPEEIFELPKTEPQTQEATEEPLEEIPQPVSAPPAIAIELDTSSAPTSISFEASEIDIDINFEVEKIVTKSVNAVSDIDAPVLTTPKLSKQVFDENQVDVIPKKLSGSRPVYPRIALRRKISGSVNIECVISASGEILNPRVVGGEQFQVFEASCLKSLKKWKYAPAMKDGHAVACRLLIPYQFGIRK
jgi:periplasmic protein TonB